MASRMEEQAKRILKFPENRIPFLSTSAAVNEDLRALHKYQIGDYTKDELKRSIALNNCLVEVTEEQIDWFIKKFNYHQLEGKVEEIKDCPFCGGEAEMVTSATIAQIVCKQCRCSSPRGRNTEPERFRLVAVWNRRVIE